MNFQLTLNGDRRALLQICRWTLVTIALSVVPQPLYGQETGKRKARDVEQIEPSAPSLQQVLAANRNDSYAAVIKFWQQLRMKQESETWKQVGIGAAQLRLKRLDEATLSLNKAIECDPKNAVAEYFLGRVCRAQYQPLPFRYHKEDAVPFRFAIHNKSPRVAGAGMPVSPTVEPVFIPHYRVPSLAKRAEQHFRRAVDLANNFDLDRPINVVGRVRSSIEPESVGPDQNPVTVRDLLISLGEEDFLQRANREICGRNECSY